VATQSAALRQADLQRYRTAGSILPIPCVLLSLLRLWCTAKVMAVAGHYQQTLPQGRTQLLRMRIDPALGEPEISGNRLMVSCA
jgi:cell division FtsZ-interacting protein ZapD